MLIDAHFVSFFFFGGFCFLCFHACKLPTYWAWSVLIKKKKIVYEFGSSLETGEEPFRADYHAVQVRFLGWFCAGAVSLRLFFVSICSKMY